MTILELLKRSKESLENRHSDVAAIGRSVGILDLCVSVLDKGYSVDVDYDALIKQHQSLGNIPPFEKPKPMVQSAIEEPKKRLSAPRSRSKKKTDEPKPS